jgi:uncharacterized protein YfkK (UPF0435 family)
MVHTIKKKLSVKMIATGISDEYYCQMMNDLLDLFHFIPWGT